MSCTNLKVPVYFTKSKVLTLKAKDILGDRVANLGTPYNSQRFLPVGATNEFIPGMHMKHIFG